jgi:flagellar biosynthetic protein FlhB
MSSDSDNSQEPTPHRRQLLRSRGQVAHSAELNSVAVLLAAIIGIVWCGTALCEQLSEMLAMQLGGSAWPASATAKGDVTLVVSQWQSIGLGLARPLVAILGMAGCAAVASSLLQTGFLILPDRVSPDLARINPLAGLRRMVSADRATQVAFGAAKLVAVIAIVGLLMADRWNELLALGTLEVSQLGGAAWQLCLAVLVRAAGVLLALACLDYLWQRWKLDRALRMSPTEIREELRALEPNPQVLAARREARKRLASAKKR